MATVLVTVSLATPALVAVWFDPVARNINPVIYIYDPRKGFTVQMPEPGRLTATCTFVTQAIKSTFHITYYIKDPHFMSEPHIKGPYENLVFVGETLELSCTVDLYHNVDDDAIHWIIPNNSSLNDITVQRINVPHGKVLINPHFMSEPHIKGPYENLVFVGETLELSCTVDLYHNVDDDAIHWIIPNNSSLNDITVQRINVPHGKVLINPHFMSEPHIKGPYENLVFVGETLELSCTVDLYHNVDDDAIHWIIPNNSSLNDITVQRINVPHGKVLINPHFMSEPHIKGPYENLVFVGETLELSCTVDLYHNVDDDAIHWIIPNNSSLNDITVQRINVPHGKVLISKLFIYNLKNIDEGRYICYLPYINATTTKFISVYDKFDVKPTIDNLTYNYAYIGQPLVLRCGVNVDHNIGFNMGWTAPNATGQHMVQMNTQYFLKVRHIHGETFFQIDNVTYQNEGNYSCHIFDFTNRITNVVKYVRVKRGEVPKIRIATSLLNNLEDISVLIYETTKLICPAVGDPKLTILWMKGSTQVRKLGSNIGFSADKSELTFFFVQRIDAGMYTCIARNPFGQVSRSVNLSVKSDSFNGVMIAVIICMNFLVIAIAITFTKFVKSSKRRRVQLLQTDLINFKEAEKVALLDYDTKWDIPREKIKLGRNLGSDYFGLVVEATVSNFFDGEPIKTVAVKMLHQNCNFTELHSFINEMKLLTDLGKHVNLINLLGACTESIVERNLLVVIEYCKHGSLRNYLLENRSNFVNLIDPVMELICLAKTEDAEKNGNRPIELQRITTLDLVRWALQVARGMEFLASTKVVHVDLAARNVLLLENYVVKIGDFGLSRNFHSNDYYRNKSLCPLPIMWMALESIRDKTFSTWSDVWSFGVVLWELFSLARTPYAKLEPDFRFYRKLESGYRLCQPEYSTREIYQVMRECWCAQPQRRPTFSRLIHTLEDLLEDVYTRCIGSGVRQHQYVDMSGEGDYSTAVSSRDRDGHTDVQNWVALNMLNSTGICINK